MEIIIIVIIMIMIMMIIMKKAGLASRNIVHHSNQIYVVSALAQNT